MAGKLASTDKESFNTPFCGEFGRFLEVEFHHEFASRVKPSHYDGANQLST